MSKVGMEELQRLSAMGQEVADGIKNGSNPARITAAASSVIMCYMSYIATVLTDIRCILEEQKK